MGKSSLDPNENTAYFVLLHFFPFTGRILFFSLQIKFISVTPFHKQCGNVVADV